MYIAADVHSHATKCEPSSIKISSVITRGLTNFPGRMFVKPLVHRLLLPVNRNLFDQDSISVYPDLITS